MKRVGNWVWPVVGALFGAVGIGMAFDPSSGTSGDRGFYGIFGAFCLALAAYSLWRIIQQAKARKSGQPAPPAVSTPQVSPVPHTPSATPAASPVRDLSPPVPAKAAAYLPTFAAIDFETANHDRGSICAVGIAIVESGELVSTGHELIRPASDVTFTNTFVHGITAADVAGAPTWDEYVPHLVDQVGSYRLVTYGNFDKSAFEAATSAAGFRADLRWYDVLPVARRALKNLPNHKLPTVAEHLEVELVNHHDPADDAKAAAQVLLAIIEQERPIKWTDLWEAPAGKTLPYFHRRREPRDVPAPNPDADPTNPLFRRHVCFSGELVTMSRADAWEAVAARGATVRKAVVLDLDYLVIPDSAHAGERGTVKVKKAIEYRDVRGRPIEVIREGDFRRLLNGDHLS